jgi:dTDP-4-amino-4,6-dideoxygalactose transaminase
MPVHVLGHLGDMEHLMRISETFGLPVIEDATEALGSYYKGKHAGSFGRMGCFSFNGNKIITCGGGGVLVTDDEELAKRAKHLTTQAKADSFEYYHDEVGYNYRLVNVSAAIGVAQMEQLPAFVRRKHEISAFYREELTGVGDIGFQAVQVGTNPNWWLFTIRTKKQRELLEHLNSHKMQSRPFWVPMNQLPICKQDLFVEGNNASEQIYRECLSIPCSTNITEEELRAITGKIKELF